MSALERGGERDSSENRYNTTRIFVVKISTLVSIKSLLNPVITIDIFSAESTVM